MSCQNNSNLTNRTNLTSLTVGKYLVSPLVRCTDSGAFAPSVSIRSGRGSATHDRVLRFHARFDTRDGAHRYAFEQGIAWLGRMHLPHPPSTETPWPRKT
jgi:hypothetical protein